MGRKYSRRIKTAFQSPRTKLLYFIYLAPENRIKDEPGIKSKIRKALHYRSDGHFYYDLRYLLQLNLLEEKQGYFIVTSKGKEEFKLHSSLYNTGVAVIALGITLIFYSLLLKIGLLMEEGIAMIGYVLIVFGVLASMGAKKDEPKLSSEAKRLLKEFRGRR